MTASDIWVFDAYGTLLDVHAAVRALSAGDEERWAAISRTWREKQLAYTWLTAASGHYLDFASLTERALDYALLRHGESGTTIRDALLSAYETLPATDGAHHLLHRLKEECSATIAILTNGGAEATQRAIKANGLSTWIDVILSAETLRTYKPDPRVYALVETIPGFQTRGDIRFVSANAWDAYHASAFGLHAIWISGEGEPGEQVAKRPTQTVARLGEVGV
ncbi:haloacid dehalogenase type II [bacterium]|nr:haloacid dehalogenase type II [bacterium]